MNEPKQDTAPVDETQKMLETLLGRLTRLVADRREWLVDADRWRGWGIEEIAIKIRREARGIAAVSVSGCDEAERVRGEACDAHSKACRAAFEAQFAARE